jgi:hypothetical protein
MKRHRVTVSALAAGICLLSGVLYAAPFEVVFKIEKITGECTVQPPGSAEFVNAVDGNAYAYGTKIRTGRKSSAILVFSEGNTCRVLANANLTITQDSKDAKLKSVVLDVGKIEMSLEPEFHKTNADSLNVVTPTAVCNAIGCKFSIDSRNEDDLLVTIFICDEGQIEIDGQGFKIPLDAEDGLTISLAKDRSFIRIKNIKGVFSIVIRDSEGNPKTVELKVGSVIKIWRSKSATGNVWIVTILITSPDGVLQEAITYNEEMLKTGEEGGSGEGAGGGAETETGTGGTTTTTQPDLGEVITTTTSTTTTTTLPSNVLPVTTTSRATTVTTGAPTPTPVGRR